MRYLIAILLCASAHAEDLTGYKINERTGHISCGTSCRLERMEKLLSKLSTHIQWLETVANQQRIDRETDAKQVDCFNKCKPMAHFDKELNDRVGNVAGQDNCFKECEDMPHSPNGGGC